MKIMNDDAESTEFYDPMDDNTETPRKIRADTDGTFSEFIEYIKKEWYDDYLFGRENPMSFEEFLERIESVVIEPIPIFRSDKHHYISYSSELDNSSFTASVEINDPSTIEKLISVLPWECEIVN